MASRPTSERQAVFRGGVDLISAVDIRYASADAKFSVREVKLAIVADVGSLAADLARIGGAKLDAPESDRFITDDDPALSQEIFDIPMTQVEAIGAPDCVADDIWWESVTFVCIHRPILTILAS